MPIYKLTPHFIEIIHDRLVVELWPSDEPVLPEEYRDRALIDSAVNRPFQTAGQKEIHPTLVDKGVALFHSLISNHPFANGNKRTAVMALSLFFCANEHCCFLEQEQIIELAREIAQYKEKNRSQDEALDYARKPIAGAILSFQDMSRKSEERHDQYMQRALEALKRTLEILRLTAGNGSAPLVIEVE